MRAAFEGSQRDRGKPVAVRDGASQTPERPSPAVLQAGQVLPARGGTAAVVEAAVHGLRIDHEPQVHVPELRQGRIGSRLTDSDDEPAGDVVDAVAVLDAGFAELGVLEEADVVTQPREMRVADRGRAHAPTAISVTGASTAASSR